MLDGHTDDGFLAICIPLLEDICHDVDRPTKGRVARHGGNRRTDTQGGYIGGQMSAGHDFRRALTVQLTEGGHSLTLYNTL